MEVASGFTSTLAGFRSVSLRLVALQSLGGATIAEAQPPRRPTIVLVHGAFAESSSWNGVISRLTSHGYRAIAVANPLRGVKADARYVSALVQGIEGEVVLVGHSYGGAVISAAKDAPNVRALVYVAAFLPENGETSLGLSGRFPGSTLGPALAPPVRLPDGDEDLSIRQDRFHAQFAADLPTRDGALMAATQRPIARAALAEPSGEPGWRKLPAWSIYGSADLNIPAEAHAFMAQRAKARRTVRIDGASHVVMISHPDAVAELIEEAAGGR